MMSNQKKNKINIFSPQDNKKQTKKLSQNKIMSKPISVLR